DERARDTGRLQVLRQSRAAALARAAEVEHVRCGLFHGGDHRLVVGSPRVDPLVAENLELEILALVPEGPCDSRTVEFLVVEDVDRLRLEFLCDEPGGEWTLAEIVWADAAEVDDLVGAVDVRLAELLLALELFRQPWVSRGGRNHHQPGLV